MRRSELFQSIKKIAQKTIRPIIEAAETGSQSSWEDLNATEVSAVSRRDFLRGTFGVGAYMMLESALGKAGLQVKPNVVSGSGKDVSGDVTAAKYTKDMGSGILDNLLSQAMMASSQALGFVAYENIKETLGVTKGSFTETALQTLMVFSGKLFGSRIVDGLGIQQTRVTSSEETDAMMKTDPIGFANLMICTGPVLEEGLYRVVPFAIRDIWRLLIERKEESGKYWRTGMTSAFLFAFSHNLDNDWSLKPGLPLSQFAGGIYYWYLMGDRGNLAPFHCVLAHSIHNSLAYTMYVLGFRYPAVGSAGK